jgi:glycosyltransferase involved in cell wall biosynthesis
MSSIPKVSVVMAVYNGARYVGQAVDSILGQTLDDFEFLIVNDGSTDNTPMILRSYDDPRISILDNERRIGLASSLNRGISRARAEYIARQDADDISYPERLFRQVRYLDQHPGVGVLGATTQWIDSENGPLQVWPLGGDNAVLQRRLMWTCPLIHGSTTFRRQCVSEVGGYDDSMRTGQDYDLWLRISETWDIACLPDILYTYRWHSGMASVKHKEEQMRHAQLCRARAIRRRLSYAKRVLGLGGNCLPPRLCGLSRRQLAQRYVWWSAGARELSRKLALHFLVIGWMFDPTAPEVWLFTRGVLLRKLGLGGE